MMDEILSRITEAVNWKDTERSGPISWLLYTNRGQTRSSILVFLFPSGSRIPRAIVKLSRDRASISREFRALQCLSHRLPDHVPGPYLHGETRAFGYLAMEALDGEAPPPVLLGGFVPEALRVLITLHHQLSEGTMSPAALAKEVLGPLREFERTWAPHDRDLSLLCDSLHRRLDTLMNVELPQLPQHGDFCVNNLLVRPDGRIAVIDWEEFATCRLPAYDLITLFASADLRGDQRARLDLFRASLKAYARDMHIDRAWLAALAPIGLMRLALFRAAEGHPEPVRDVLSLLRRLAVSGGPDLAGMAVTHGARPHV
jgi:aminoglycoside phosphotransferase (APT) family kinase protein